MTMAIIGFTVVVSLLAFKDRKVFENLLFAPFEMHVQRDWFRFLTHGFVHGNMPHLFINMFVLYQFGRTVEKAYAEITHRSSMLPFLLLYVGALVVSSIPGYYKHRYDPNYRAVGASGATSAVLFAAILMFPTKDMGWPPGPYWLVGLLFLGYEWYMSKRGNDGIAHDAHFYGALFGIAFTMVLDPTSLERCIAAIRG